MISKKKKRALFLGKSPCHLSIEATVSHSFAAASSDFSCVMKRIWCNSPAWLFSHHLTAFVEQHLRKKVLQDFPI